MSNQALKAVVGTTVATQEKDPSTFPGMLKAFSGEIARALPKHMNADRLCRIALTCFRQTPLLQRCTPMSVFAAVIQASQWGLEPGLNGRSFLVPYKKKDGSYECQLIPGWKGLVELANRTGRCAVWTGAHFRGDEAFEYQLGDSPFVHHKPGGEYDPAMLMHTYAVGRIKGNDWPVIEVWTAERIRKHRDRFNKVGKDHYSFTNWEMYARKVPLMQVLKYMPSSPELEAAIAADDSAEIGRAQGITIDAAIAGTYEPPAADPQQEHGGEHVDTSTGEVSQGEAPTYAQVFEAMSAAAKAKDRDAFDSARDLIRGVASEQHRAELDVEARKLAKAFA